jgi:hypothetical protein
LYSNRSLGRFLRHLQRGRLFTFPNVYEYLVGPVTLKDQSKLGYCKLILLYLVDPTLSIQSTADIPPQDPSLCSYSKQAVWEVVGDYLPPEVISIILGYLNMPLVNELPLDDALRQRAHVRGEVQNKSGQLGSLPTHPRNVKPVRKIRQCVDLRNEQATERMITCIHFLSRPDRVARMVGHFFRR